MPPTPTIDDKVHRQFVRILNRALGAKDDGGDLFLQLRTELFAVMDQIDADSTYFQRLREEIDRLNPRSCSRLIVYVKALDESYRAGMFDSAFRAIESQVAMDYMQQAENLLAGDGTGKFAHIPAAVLAGAVLEDRLRRLCQRQNPAISMRRANNQQKTLNDFIDDLKRAGIYEEPKAKLLRAWADIRNAAAHGRFDAFSCGDVEQMIAGIKSFLAEYV